MTTKTQIVWGDEPEERMVVPEILSIAVGELLYLNLPDSSSDKLLVESKSHHLSKSEECGTLYTVTLICRR